VLIYCGHGGLASKEIVAVGNLAVFGSLHTVLATMEESTVLATMKESMDVIRM